MTEQDEFYFQQRNASSQPLEIEIVGPNNLVSDITSITTVPLSRELVERTADLTVELEIPEGILGIKPDIVSINLESLSVITRTIPLINIEYPQDKLSLIIPQTVTVKLEGPADRIQRIRPQMITAYINIPEGYEYDFANIQFRLPEDVKLVEFTPVRVQIFHHE
jgi:YbbR domain-containing protein